MRVRSKLSLFAALALPLTVSGALAQSPSSQEPITGQAIEQADILNAFASQDRPYILQGAGVEETADGVEQDAAADKEAAPERPNAAIVRVQVLLDQAGASPGVIDGYDGDNLRKGIMAFQTMHNLPSTGNFDADFLSQLQGSSGPVTGTYTVTADDVSAIGEPIPSDYAEMAQRDFLGYASMDELVAEKFHMDVDLLNALNPDADFAEGDEVTVVMPGEPLSGEVARIEADKDTRQLRAYDANDKLIAAYPATIGSEDNPSPSGTHEVQAVAPMPNYTYNPDVNFKQGSNDEVLTIPPGPNGPVGSMWIDLSEPTYGIHGTPEPALIDKTASHGCVRLTNWDAEELAEMVEEGVPVEFL